MHSHELADTRFGDSDSASDRRVDPRVPESDLGLLDASSGGLKRTQGGFVLRDGAVEI